MSDATDGRGEPREVLARVLVVDDNRDSAESLAALLELLGHETCSAFDGETALAKADEFRPQVVLLDIGLPGMDGYAVARALRSRGGGGPVLVALTGYGRSEDRERSRAAGFDHHLVKPVGIDALRTVFATRR